MTAGWPRQSIRNVIPTEDPKDPSGGIFGGRSQRAPTQLHRSLHSLRSVGMTGIWTARPAKTRRHTKTFLCGFFALFATLRLQSCVSQALQPRNGILLKITVGGETGSETESGSGSRTRGSAAGTEDEVTTGWPRQPCRNFVLSEGAKRPSRRICAGRGKDYGRESAPRSKYRGADTDHRGALGDGNLEVVAHAHRKLGKRMAHFVFEPIA